MIRSPTTRPSESAVPRWMQRSRSACGVPLESRHRTRSSPSSRRRIGASVRARARRPPGAGTSSARRSPARTRAAVRARSSREGSKRREAVKGAERLALESVDGGALQDGAVGREARAVARAVPAALGVVEVDLAAEVRADRRDRAQRAVLVAVAGDLLAAVADDVALPGREVLESRARPRLGQAVAEEVRADLRVLREQPGAAARGFRRRDRTARVRGFSRPSTRSASTRAAAVPLVIPHFAKPVAMSTRDSNGVSAPDERQPVAVVLSCADQR